MYNANAKLVSSTTYRTYLEQDNGWSFEEVDAFYESLPNDAEGLTPARTWDAWDLATHVYNNSKLVPLAPLVLSEEMVIDPEGFATPAWIEANGQRFTYDTEHGGTYPGLYVEPEFNAPISETSYYEIEEL